LTNGAGLTAWYGEVWSTVNVSLKSSAGKLVKWHVTSSRFFLSMILRCRRMAGNLAILGMKYLLQDQIMNNAWRLGEPPCAAISDKT